MPPANKNKGKARDVGPTERSPLLGGSRSADAGSVRSRRSHSDSITEHPADTVATTNANQRSRRFAILLTVFSLLLGVTLFVVLLLASFVPSDMEKESLHEAFVYSDPKVDILNVSDDGVHINLTLRGGVDVDRALAVDGRRGTGLWESIRQRFAHGVVGALPTQAVHVTLPEVLVYSRGGGLPLLNVTLPAAIIVPLTKSGELVPIAVEAVGNPVAAAGELWTWGQDTWAKGTIDVVVGVAEAQATIPGAWWSKWAVVDQRDIIIPLAVPVPPVPNLPPPGSPLDLSKLVTLDNYTFSTDPGLKITARATLPNPALKAVPFALPFAIQIGPKRETIAEVVARAATINAHTIGLVIEGDIVALGEGDALSTFLQNYLHGNDNPIVVRGLRSMPPDYTGPDAPPPWILHSLPSLQLDLIFPSPKDRPDIIRSVTIEKMRLGEANGHMMASGTVVAHIQLPQGMEQVLLNVSAIKPDVMVHDGVVEGDDEYDPENPPPKAFGRIAPDYYLNSTTLPSDDPQQPHLLVVRAPFDNLLLDVLPDRDHVLSNFVTKVIVKGGATAGIAGIVDVKADLGVGGTLDIDGLPVKGEFYVGRSFGARLQQWMTS